MGSEIFMIRSPLTNSNAIIFGRNSFSLCCKEIAYFSSNTEGTTKCSNIEVTPESSHAYIVNGTCGANEKNLSLAVLFADQKPSSGLTALDLTKLTLERADSAEKAVEVITELIEKYNAGDDAAIESLPKYAFFICDINDVFVLDVVGKMWAAEKVEESFRAFGNSLSVKSKIDKKSDGLEDRLKDLGLYDGNGELNFSNAFSLSSDLKWPCDEPESGFSAQKMFEVLRSSTSKDQDEIASSFVSVSKQGVPVYWFTLTKNPIQSVFKPFIFTSGVRLSPLSALKDGDDETYLRKLHANRNWDQVGDLLQTLEKSCVDEVDGYVDDAPLDELDELLKDCVEAEVKFYR